MKQTRSPAVDLAERLCRPQRIGILGRRGVGKTTLLTMLYREAVGGRLPGLRLAAADERTAAYLADKIVQLEAGQPVPATLAEMELRFHLYSRNARHELVFLDYQGEHITLGRHEPIRDFLRDCDVVWLCLDAPVTGDGTARLQAEQEVEQAVEDYLATERAGEPHRPMALLLTRSDLLGDPGDALTVQALFEQNLGMTRHALRTHCPWHDVFAVSSLGPADGPELQPVGLDGPLTWLADSLRAQDEARLDHLWKIAPNNPRLLERPTRAFARRHPADPATRAFQTRLSRLRWRRRGRALLAGAAVLLFLVLGVFGYDALGEYRVRQTVEQHTDDPAAALEAWRTFHRWHPTRGLTRPAALADEQRQMADLERILRDRAHEERLAAIRRQADDLDADPETVRTTFARFRDDFAEYDLDTEGKDLQDRIQRAARMRREAQARLALRDLDRAESKGELSALLAQADRLLKEHAGTEIETEVHRRRLLYLARMDERDYETARDYSTRQPHNYFTRRERYQQYLDRHPRGRYASAAREAIDRIGVAWDRHDFRAVADYYRDHPADVKELRARCRTYLAAHPDGTFRRSAGELLRWCDRVSEPNEYTVTLKSGSFSSKAAHLLSRGPYLSVEIEVAGVRYGPSSIVARSYAPEWDFEFPRKVRWKLGDSVRVLVTDNYYWKRRIADVTFDDEPLALRRLNGEVEVRYGRVAFECELGMPVLPKVD